MRHSYLLLLGLCASVPAWGLTFQTRLENARWTAAGDQFECRLSQQVDGFGVGEFVWRAGEQPTFRLKPQRNWAGSGSATLLAAAPPWRPTQVDIDLGPVALVAGEVSFTSSQQQAGRLLDGVLEGRSPEVRLRAAGGQDLRVRLLAARFADGYAQLQDCSTKMLPVNFDQVRQAQVGFPGGGDALDAVARAKLDIVLQYLKADPTVNRIELDGHSDNSGNRLSNRDISRRRALAVMEYLKAHGVPEEQVTVRFYGERYPLVKNNSEANRARNRRVTLHLSREALPETPPAPTATPNAAQPGTTPPEAPAPAAPQAKAPAGNAPASAPLGQPSARGA